MANQPGQPSQFFRTFRTLTGRLSASIAQIGPALARTYRRGTAWIAAVLVGLGSLLGSSTSAQASSTPTPPAGSSSLQSSPESHSPESQSVVTAPGVVTVGEQVPRVGPRRLEIEIKKRTANVVTRAGIGGRSQVVVEPIDDVDKAKNVAQPLTGQTTSGVDAPDVSRADKERYDKPSSTTRKMTTVPDSFFVAAPAKTGATNVLGK